MLNNRLAVRHGIFAREVLNEDEATIYEMAKQEIREAVPDLDGASDEMQLHMLCIFYAKLATAIRIGHQDGIDKQTSRIKGLLSTLAIRRDKRKASEAPASLASPAQYAAALIAQAQSRGALPPGSKIAVMVEVGDGRTSDALPVKAIEAHREDDE